jgi:glycosyltransferase involved in cell wall biosynthesis
MKTFFEYTIDTNLFSPANWPDYSNGIMRVAWIDESNGDTESPLALQLIPHLAGVSLIKLEWNNPPHNAFALAHFFDQVEVVLLLGQYNKDATIFQAAASMGRVVVTDLREQSLFNHGESGLVVAPDPQSFAEALLLLREAPKLRGTLGKNLRRKFIQQLMDES